MAGLSAAAGAVVLTLGALLLGMAGSVPGPAVYALLFGIAGIAGLVELWALAHLPWPGKVMVPKLATAPTLDAVRMRNFLSFAALASLGSGLAPYFSAYAIVILHTPAGAAVAIGAATAATSVIASTMVVARLPGRSASRFLRASYVGLGLAWLAMPLAHPANKASFAVLLLVAIAVTAAASVTALATTERLFRLAPGPGAIAHQGRFVAVTAGSTTVGQLINAALLSLGPAGFATFAGLAVASGLTRLAAAARLQVSPGWESPTGVWRAEELGTKVQSRSA